jgi:hypothetical protein
MERTSGANYDNSSGYRMFTDGPPGTTVEEDFLNGVQEELCHAIESTAQTLSSTDRTQVMQTIGLTGFGMRNGKIVPSVAANVLTVAIKTLAGNDPSTLNPVYVRIGDNIRKITAALNAVTTAMTDHWSRTSYTYSLFVYLGWDSVNSRVEILLCPQPTYLVYPAVNPAAPNPRRLISYYGSHVGTAITTGHILQVIGRIDDVVQSAANNYTGVTATNVINYPIYKTNYLTSPNVPVKSNVADTAPVFTTNTFEYYLDNDICYFNFNFLGDGGVDGAGVAGFLVLYMPFFYNNTIVGTNRLASGVVTAADLDAGNSNNLTMESEALQYFFFTAGRLVAGGAVYYLNCSMFLNGNRQLMASGFFPILK